MDTQFRCSDNAHLFGRPAAAESATHPIRPPSGTLAALLVLAGQGPAASSRLASAPDDDLLGRVQLPLLG
ncbi:hypothetical protein [Ottowia caeni]|uniref:hypothetical protein n=1 Tax=Ottowia caeni TaxID=2870339 RepID=UPI003D75865C